MKKANVNAGHNRNKTENVTTQSIKTFFKSASKLPVAEASKKDEFGHIDATKTVYVEFLKNKLQEIENGSDVAVRREEIQDEIVVASAVVTEKEIVKTADVVQTGQCIGCKDWETKYKNLKKEYMKMGTGLAELRIKYDDLLNTQTYSHANPSDINDVVSSTASEEIFASNEIMFLQSMSLDQPTDSTFILRCLEYAYKNNLSCLLDKTMKGKPVSMIISDDGDVAYMPGKDPMSPQKIKAIRDLFVKRITKCDLKPAANEKRMKDSYMNKLIASGITNIGKKTPKDK